MRARSQKRENRFGRDRTRRHHKRSSSHEKGRLEPAFSIPTEGARAELSPPGSKNYFFFLAFAFLAFFAVLAFFAFFAIASSYVGGWKRNMRLARRGGPAKQQPRSQSEQIRGAVVALSRWHRDVIHSCDDFTPGFSGSMGGTTAPATIGRADDGGVGAAPGRGGQG
jgi:hypothetical protein